MGYTETLLEWNSNSVQGTPDVLSSAADHNGTFDVTRPITVLGVGAIITTAVTVTAAVVRFDRRITKGSDTGRGDGDVGILTIPIGAAVGQVIVGGAFVELFGSSTGLKIDLDPGDEVVPQVTVTATAGGAHYVIYYVPRSEMPANIPDWVKSVT